MMEEVLLSRNSSPSRLTNQEKIILNIPPTWGRVKSLIRTKDFRKTLSDDQIMKYLYSISERVPSVKYSIEAIAEQLITEAAA